MWRALPVASSSPATWAWFPANTARAASATWEPLLSKLLVEAAQTTVRKDEGFRKEYQRRCHRRPKGVAKVAAARKLAVRLYWMLRSHVSYPEIARVESNPRVALGDV